MRIATVLAVALLGTTSLAGAQHAQAAIRHYELNIPRQSLDSALKDLAQQTGLQIGRFSGSIDGSAMVGPIKGDQTPEQALKTLLNNTGLNYKIVNDTTIAVYKLKDLTSSTTGIPGSDSPFQDPGQGQGVRDKKDDGSSGDRLQLAQATQRSDQTNASVSPQQSTLSTRTEDKQRQSDSAKIDEIVVTAEKRAERLQDVPVPVTAISAQSLIENNELRIQDYYQSVPGFDFTSSNHGEPNLAIRGITTSTHGNPTVGIVIDDVPFGSSTGVGSGGIAPDIDPNDLTRVEVLRGPQGTLYGSNSMGGLIKYVTVDPSTESITGRIQAGTSSVHNGSELGYNARGSVNVPLTDTWAVRVSAFTRLDPGYIDNVEAGQRGANEGHADGARLSSLWRPSDALSLKVSALIQDNKTNGYAEVFMQPNLGDLQQQVLNGAGRFDSRLQSYSANLSANLGGVKLTALSGYNVQSNTGWSDESPVYGRYAESLFGVAGSSSSYTTKTDKFTQEIRVSVPITQRIEWLVGGFYTHENSPVNSFYYAADPVTGALVASLAQVPILVTYEERAAFTDLTFDVTDQFDVQFGARESHIDQTLLETVSGVLVGRTSVSQGDTSADAFTYLVTPRFKLSPDLMVYARLASGYRPGGPNVNSALAGVPSQYDPDKTQNYEIGVKGDVRDHALSFDASLYYIDWKDIQLNLSNGFAYTANGAAAKSEGIELALESRPLTGLTIDGWVTFGDAELTQHLPPTSIVLGASGDRLPYSTRFSGHVSLQQDFPLTDRMTGFVGGAMSYVGDRVGMFQRAAVRQNYAAYANTDLRGGIKYDSWTVNCFVTNLADKRGLLGGGLDTIPATAFTIIQPRTVGLSVSKTF